jgi:hypothetical protein
MKMVERALWLAPSALDYPEPPPPIRRWRKLGPPGGVPSGPRFLSRYLLIFPFDTVTVVHNHFRQRPFPIEGLYGPRLSRPQP